jgi:hypothetical protein
MKNLAKAVIAVMKDVKGVEKSMTVGSGNYSYKGVSDYEVKKIYNKSMVEHGLCILPVGVKDDKDINRYVDGYGKQKISVLVSVTTEYLLLHESGESQVIMGYGHGIDSGDKAAGKATTYALKYALLYTFMTPTGAIDDTDTTHSEEIVALQAVSAAKKEALTESHPQFGAIKLLLGGGSRTMVQLKEKFTVSKAVEKILTNK